MIYLVSGKRAVGKDTFCDIFKKCFGKRTVRVVALADAPKIAFCEEHNLDLKRFMTDRAFKNSYRKEFIEYAELRKLSDKYVWCREAMNGCEMYDDIIISDLRFPIELFFFRKYFKSGFTTIRIEASDKIRGERGWKYFADVDDHVSETGMDDIDFDFVIKNNSNDNGGSIIKQIRDLEIIH